MNIIVNRHNIGNDWTVGDLEINGDFRCYTLEDEKREHKVFGETCIPAGTYEITFRDYGGFHNSYKNKFGDWHKGMLWIRNVENFKYILIHIGNYTKNTNGCLLVGSGIQPYGDSYMLTDSTKAYKKIYPEIRDALLRGKKVNIIFKDSDL